jgi:hypothetical protein
MTSALFRDFEQCRMAVSCRRFCTTHSSYLQKSSWRLKMGPIGCPITSVRNCHSTLRKIPKERRPHLHSGEGIKSSKIDGVRNYCAGNITARSGVWIDGVRHYCAGNITAGSGVWIYVGAHTLLSVHLGCSVLAVNRKPLNGLVQRPRSATVCLGLSDT